MRKTVGTLEKKKRTAVSPACSGTTNSDIVVKVESNIHTAASLMCLGSYDNWEWKVRGLPFYDSVQNSHIDCDVNID